MKRHFIYFIVIVFILMIFFTWPLHKMVASLLKGNDAVISTTDGNQWKTQEDIKNITPEREPAIRTTSPLEHISKRRSDADKQFEKAKIVAAHNNKKDGARKDQDAGNVHRGTGDVNRKEIAQPADRPAVNVNGPVTQSRKADQITSGKTDAQHESSRVPNGLSRNNTVAKSPTPDQSALAQSGYQNAADSVKLPAPENAGEPARPAGIDLNEHPDLHAGTVGVPSNADSQADLSPVVKGAEENNQSPDTPRKEASSKSAARERKEADKKKSKPKQGDIYTNRLGMRFVYIDPGQFLMGSRRTTSAGEHDETLHRVTLANGFFLQTTEVTQRHWMAVMKTNPSRFQSLGLDHPVEYVSWFDVQEFLKQMNLLLGSTTYRLPTEAEWEFAARAGSDGPFCFGRCLTTDQANFNGRLTMQGCDQGIFRQHTMAVGSFPPNAWGFYDMYGNVMEWCQDYYGRYDAKAAFDPIGPALGQFRCVRGGGWYSTLNHCRSSFRDFERPAHRDYGIGFRVAMDVPSSFSMPGK